MSADASNEFSAMLRDIRSGPQGPDIGAFFDFDGTIIQGFHRVRTTRQRSVTALLLSGLPGAKTAAHRRRNDLRMSRAWRGVRVTDFEQVEDRLFTRFIAGHLFPEAWQLIRAHRAAGHTVVITTGATRYQARGCARALGVGHLLCTEPAIVDGVLTGEVDGRTVWGRHKADIVEKFSADNGVRLDSSYGYSNGGADVPMLCLVGNATAINPDHGLRSAASHRNWRVLWFPRRTRLPIYRAARTVLAVIAVAVTGTAARLLSLGQDRRTTADRICTWVSRGGLHCAGLRVRITGIEHARMPRPAVYIFNHQSQLDTLIVPYVLRTRFTGVVTNKARHYPILGTLLRSVGVTFIDTTAPAHARQALEPLVAVLKSGTSVAIAPEGQVSPTPEPLAFKKGAFHLAIQAGVPIIPIVIHNSGRALWRSAMFIQPGPVDVTVLEPIDICSWHPNEFDRRIDNLRQLYIDTLTHP